jgi:hypothetical protein
MTNFFIILSPYKKSAPTFSFFPAFVGFMDEEIAGTDDLAILFKIFCHQPTRTVFKAMVALIVENAFQKHAYLLLVRAYLKLIAFCELFYRADKVFFGELNVSRAAYFFCFLGRDFDVGIFNFAGWADFRGFDPIVDVVADKTSPIFSHVVLSLLMDHFF